MFRNIKNKAKTGMGKLTDGQVRDIRSAREIFKKVTKEYSKAALAKEYGVSIYIIDSVWNDRAYGHVK